MNDFADRTSINGGAVHPIIGASGDRYYEGVDLTVKWSAEIAASPYNGDPWAWIRARIRAGDFTGIHTNDYIPFKTTNNISLKACVAGINTYKDYGDTAVGAHIDFICRELWPTLHVYNKVNYNNGISSQEYPWLASDLYHYINSLSGSVPNEAKVNPATVAVNYTADGIYYYLPATLKAVIIEKRMLLPKRFSSSGLLNDDNNWGWADAGKLWVPTECEVYGTPVWGDHGFGAGGSAVQYPIFAGNMNRVKYRSGSRYNWWLLSAASGNSTYCCYVSGDGSASGNNAGNTSIAAPVCFRVS